MRVVSPPTSNTINTQITLMLFAIDFYRALVPVSAVFATVTDIISLVTTSLLIVLAYYSSRYIIVTLITVNVLKVNE